MKTPVKKTPKQWTEYLAMEHNPVTLEEYTAACLSMMLGHTMAQRAAAEHTEGMLGAIDLFASEVAQRSGIPYATSGKIREALDNQRDQMRLKAGQGEPS